MITYKVLWEIWVCISSTLQVLCRPSVYYHYYAALDQPQEKRLKTGFGTRREPAGLAAAGRPGKPESPRLVTPRRIAC